MKLKTPVKKLFRATAIGVATLLAMPAQAAEEINVVLFSMSYTQGLAKLADDFEAKTGIKANIEAVSYTHLRSPRDRTRSRMPSSA